MVLAPLILLAITQPALQGGDDDLSRMLYERNRTKNALKLKGVRKVLLSCQYVFEDRAEKGFTSECVGIFRSYGLSKLLTSNSEDKVVSTLLINIGGGKSRGETEIRLYERATVNRDKSQVDVPSWRPMLGFNWDLKYGGLLESPGGKAWEDAYVFKSGDNAKAYALDCIRQFCKDYLSANPSR